MEREKSVYISTYGCQMNVNDSERMHSLLEMIGYTSVSEPENASLIILNTCSVREKPVHKVRSEIGKYRLLKNKNPHLKIGVGGCVGQQEKENIFRMIPLVDFVFGTDSIDLLPSLVEDLYAKSGNNPKQAQGQMTDHKTNQKNDQKIVASKFEHRKPYHIETLIRNPGVSTFVNITKGCNNFCTFCVVPFTRGRERSRPLQHILNDVHSLIKRGVKEVTLLGQNVNSYQSECGASFSELLKRLAVETDIQRIRFVTSHPKDFGRDLVDVMAQYSDKICEYIHLPVQSGSTPILEKMNRGYSQEEYLEKVKMIREFLPQVVFSTDIIVGFPGETEDDFQETLKVVKEVQYETLFSFKYSARPFTKAARFDQQIPEEVKDDRLTRLIDFHKELAHEMVQKYEGKVLQVLVESFNEEMKNFSGRSTQNKLIHFMGSGDLIGKTVPIRITQAFPNTLRGELVQ